MGREMSHSSSFDGSGEDVTGEPGADAFGYLQWRDAAFVLTDGAVGEGDVYIHKALCVNALNAALSIGATYRTAKGSK